MECVQMVPICYTLRMSTIADLSTETVITNAFGDFDSLHHAYCIEGPVDAIEQAVALYIEDKFHISSKGNPNVLRFAFDALRIDDARGLRGYESRRAIGASQKFIIVTCNSIQHEAQNALLKMTEEPTSGTHFFFLMPSASALLPTLRSRMVVISVPHTDASGDTSSEISLLAHDFLRAPLAGRLKMAKKLATEVNDEDKTRADMVTFVALIERAVVISVHPHPLPKKTALFLTDLALFKRHLAGRSSSVKMILEWVALSAPTPKPEVPKV
jgi:hypothetical protein